MLSCSWRGRNYDGHCGSKTLISEAILGLHFLQEQQATIDLAAKRLCLRGGGKDIPLKEPTTRHYQSEMSVWVGQ